jgi:hypothetical protein
LTNVDKELCRVIKRDDEIDVIIDYLIKQEMVHEMVVKEYDDWPWGLVHDDIHAGNLIVDEDFRIVGYRFMLEPTNPESSTGILQLQCRCKRQLHGLSSYNTRLGMSPLTLTIETWDIRMIKLCYCDFSSGRKWLVMGGTTSQS